MPRIPIVIFAQVPPPEHGQSRMVQLALETLRADPERFDVHHVNARFSESLEDIGESSLRKAFPIARYLFDAVRMRFRLNDPLLYYVPGPAKWSSVFRDWVLLGVLRLFYRRVVFHWHAIGHGEWAHGSERLNLDGLVRLEKLARRISAWILDRPYASLCVSATSRKDSIAVSSQNEITLCNGIEDPCPDYETGLKPERIHAQREIGSATNPCFRILFLSHGTEEKGLLDAVEALQRLLKAADPQWRFAVTFAGGVGESLEVRFDRDIENLQRSSGDRLKIRLKDYVTGEDKWHCYRQHDIYLAPSRWESFGLTVVEAMAHGMQVVATTSDGVQGVLPEGHPYLTPTSDPEALSVSLLKCCEDLRAELRVEEGNALRQRFLDLYQLKYFAGNLAECLMKLGMDGALPMRTGINDHGPKIRQPVLQSPAARGVGTSATNEHRLRSGTESPSIYLSVYLADQNPGHDRSFGISRMSQVVLEALQKNHTIRIGAIVSKTSQQAPEEIETVRILPWGTRRKTVRLLTDHLHPLFSQRGFATSLHYFPKGYLPVISNMCKPSVVTIHDTIIQYDEDHYPLWRKAWEYSYWAMMLKHTLRRADRIMTVSESSKRQIQVFMDRHQIQPKEITVTYEPCLYERLPQPVNPAKENYVIHLASCEPHKRSAHLIRWWHEAESQGRNLPMLHLIGTVPPEVVPMLRSSRSIVKRPFLEDSALQAAYQEARALILPSEIEGFGLPALEAYYLGTPVCFVEGTSVEEILGVATCKGAFTLENPVSLFTALDEVMAMSPAEIRDCGLKLRETYAADKVAARMLSVFREVTN